MIYGALPEDLGLIDLSPVEMMFWLYCPISSPGELEDVPANLQQFAPILDAVFNYDPQLYDDSYVYLTAKTLYVSGDSANRPGWHADGFGTDDVNYIWYDRAPTQFMEGSFPLPTDCADAMAYMAFAAENQPIITYPNKHLLRLTPAVIHRVQPNVAPGVRTFVKVSLSKDRYNLEGNSVNHRMRQRWPMLPRDAERNHPTKRVTA
jgi:hypothetical protein